MGSTDVAGKANPVRSPLLFPVYFFILTFDFVPSLSKTGLQYPSLEYFTNNSIKKSKRDLAT